jgi:SAM-dependent methyltransferase
MTTKPLQARSPLSILRLEGITAQQANGKVFCMGCGGEITTQYFSSLTAHPLCLECRDKTGYNMHTSTQSLGWHFKNVSPYFEGNEIEFYKLGFSSVSEMQAFLKRSQGREFRLSDRVLDIGCGVGRLARFIAPQVYELIGIDVSEGMVEAANSLSRNFVNTAFHKVDGNGSIPSSKNQFNIVFAHGTFGYEGYMNSGKYFIADRRDITRAYIKESYRVLKEGGVLVFQIPNFRVPLGLFSGCDKEKGEERLKLLLTGRLGHPTKESRLGQSWSKREIVACLQGVGFKNVQVERPALRRIYYLVSAIK